MRDIAEIANRNPHFPYQQCCITEKTTEIVATIKDLKKGKW